MTVYNICIVDDEPYIVHCVADLLTEHNFPGTELEVYTAYNVAEALKLFERVRIDILISDIEMPDMDGFQLVKRIKERFPMCKAIFLTAYPKYEYAISALNLGIISYVLKTDQDEKIIQSVGTAIEQLEAELSRVPDHKEVPWDEADRFFSRIVQDPPTLPLAEIQDAIHQINFDEKKPTAMIAAYVSGIHADVHQKYQIRMLMNHYLSCMFCRCVSMHRNDFVYWLLQTDEQHPETYMDRWLLNTLETILSAFEHTANTTLTLAFCGEVKYIWELPKIYSRLSSTLPMLQPSCVYALPRTEPASQSPHSLNEKPDVLIHKMRFTLEQRDYGGFVDCLRATESFFSGPMENTPLQFSMYCAVIGLLIEYSGDFFTQHPDFYTLFTHPASFSDWHDGYVRLREIVSLVFPKKKPSTYVSDRLMKQIMRYIDSHKGENISLTDLSEETGYNASYLSHFFTTHQGINLSRYLAQERLSYIKELMKDENISLSAVAQMTGFESRSYFNRFIHRMTGMSPQELRISIQPST